MAVEPAELDALLDRYRDRFRRLVETILAEREGPDPFQVPLDEFRELDDDARARLVERAGTIAWERIERELRARDWAWLVLVGDEVVAGSPDPGAVPWPDEVLKLGEPAGRVAYLFMDDTTEETDLLASSWTPLRGGDRYPTLPLALGAPGTEPVAVTADLDTGAYASFVDAHLASARPVAWFDGRHLGRRFRWCPMSLDVVLATPAGALHRSMPMLAVRDWTRSPFVRINPGRTVLAGRDLLRAFGLTIVLRAPEARTEIVAGR